MRVFESAMKVLRADQEFFLVSFEDLKLQREKQRFMEKENVYALFIV